MSCLLSLTRWQVCACGLLLLVLVSLSGPAAAHAVPVRANLPIAGDVPALPAQLEVWFDQELDTRLSTLSVIGPDGQPADLGDATVDLMEPSRQLLTVSLKPDSPVGTYTVQWHSVSAVDKDGVDGSFQFTVDPAAAPYVSPVPTPLPPVMTDTSQPDHGRISLSNALLVAFIVGLVVVIGVNVWRGRTPHRGNGSDEL